MFLGDGSEYCLFNESFEDWNLSEPWYLGCVVGLERPGENLWNLEDCRLSGRLPGGELLGRGWNAFDEGADGPGAEAVKGETFLKGLGFPRLSLNWNPRDGAPIQAR